MFGTVFGVFLALIWRKVFHKPSSLQTTVLSVNVQVIRLENSKVAKSIFKFRTLYKKQQKCTFLIFVFLLGFEGVDGNVRVQAQREGNSTTSTITTESTPVVPVKLLRILSSDAREKGEKTKEKYDVGRVRLAW